MNRMSPADVVVCTLSLLGLGVVFFICCCVMHSEIYGHAARIIHGTDMYGAAFSQVIPAIPGKGWQLKHLFIGIFWFTFWGGAITLAVKTYRGEPDPIDAIPSMLSSLLTNKGKP